MTDRLQHYISQIETSKNLPTLPHILVKLIKACQDENGSIQDIAKIIRTDASMSAKVLKLANSSYFRSTDKIAQIDHALARMGREAVKNLVISSAIHQVFNKSDIMSDSFNLKRFWRHSLTSAVLARMIAEKTGYNLPEQAFLAAMIHDIGRLILITNFPDEYKTVLDGSENSTESVIDRETKMGVPHTEIGAWLLGRWNFDSMTVDAVRYHHEPVTRIKESFPLVRIVYAANDLSRSTGSSDDGFSILQGLFSCTFPDAAGMILQADEEVQDLADFFGFAIGKKETVTARDISSDIKTPDLVSEVKDQSLLLGVLQNLAACPDENTTLRVIQEGLNILFDVSKVIFFLIDPDDGLLKAKVVNDQGCIDSIPGLILSLHNRESLISQSIQKNTLLSSLTNSSEKELSILDEQILHLLDSQGLICVPLIRAGETLGTIIIGMDGQAEKVLMQEGKLLKFYKSQVEMSLYVERLKQTQAKKIVSERLSATTDFARKVVHEANNPLSITKNYLKILSSRLEAGNPAQNEIRIIGEEMDRVSRILKELSDFSKSRDLTRMTLDLNILLGDIVKIVSQSLPASFDIRIHTTLAPTVPQIRSDRDALKQVFINLIKNAVEALTGHGNIYIETSYVPLTTNSVHKLSGPLDRSQVRIVIHDDGPGISPEVAAHLFEPYTSTKGNGHSGIGLSVVYSMIRELGGSITVDSTLGKGAVFTMMLPVHSA